MKRLIRLAGLTFYAHHGAYHYEQQNGQPFVVDVEITYQAKDGSDRLADALDYRAVYTVVAKTMEGEPMRLIEAMAERIGRDVLATFLLADKVVVRVRKPWAPLGGLSQHTEAESVHER
ncbi:MAG: dihydroneopterin aldolase [Sulfobacillus sp.]